jgi:predicted nucleic acid-binding protein
MRIYWDSSALLWFFARRRLTEIKGITRTHSLAEVFSALTGRGIILQMEDGTLHQRKYSPLIAAAIVEQIYRQLEFVDLPPEGLVRALSAAHALGVQGGRVHDYLHVKAAEAAGAQELWTADENDLSGLGRVPVVILSEDVPS